MITARENEIAFIHCCASYLLGKIEAGTVTKGQMVTIMPSKISVKVAGIYLREEEEMKVAKAGESVRIGLSGCEETDVYTGYMLCDAKDVCKVRPSGLAHVCAAADIQTCA